MNTTTIRPIYYFVTFSHNKTTWEYLGRYDTLKKARRSAASLRNDTKFQTTIYKGSLGGEIEEN